MKHCCRHIQIIILALLLTAGPCAAATAADSPYDGTWEGTISNRECTTLDHNYADGFVHLEVKGSTVRGEVGFGRGPSHDVSVEVKQDGSFL